MEKPRMLSLINQDTQNFNKITYNLCMIIYVINDMEFFCNIYIHIYKYMSKCI